MPRRLRRNLTAYALVLAAVAVELAAASDTHPGAAPSATSIRPEGSRLPPPPVGSERGSAREVRDWSSIDTAVRTLPSQDSIPALARSLSALAHDDWERIRAIFLWLTENIAYDAQAFFSGRQAQTQAQDVFRTRTTVCQGYAELFLRLATEMGLHARLISGYTKGYGYRPGERFSSTNHA